LTCIGTHPTAQYKYEELAKYASEYGPRILVETGLYNGHGSGMNIQDRGLFDRYIIIDLQKSNCQLAKSRFPLARVFEGDSAEILPLLFKHYTDLLDAPTLFWLDAHGIDDDPDFWPACPIEAELNAIAASPIGAQSVILIDDLCMFGPHASQPLKTAPGLEQLRELVDGFGLWDREDKDCIMRLTPR
jgi:hypothetical protein